MKSKKFLGRLSMFVVFTVLWCAVVVNASAEQPFIQNGITDKVILEDGTIVRAVEPPSGWNPEAATDEELSQYSYPARPSDPPKIDEWKDLVKGEWTKPILEKLDKRPSKPSKASKKIDSISSTATDLLNWAGYYRLAASYGANGTVQVPNIDATTANRPA